MKQSIVHDWILPEWAVISNTFFNYLSQTPTPIKHMSTCVLLSWSTNPNTHKVSFIKVHKFRVKGRQTYLVNIGYLFPWSFPRKFVKSSYLLVISAIIGMHFGSEMDKRIWDFRRQMKFVKSKAWSCLTHQEVLFLDSMHTPILPFGSRFPAI